MSTTQDDEKLEAMFGPETYSVVRPNDGVTFNQFCCTALIICTALFLRGIFLL